ncbi:hypothetical protein [Sphingomonas sanxanigenens]|uniref:hypothetical protein n=1 Tax=Sphingomonas sanxanigenens TaxID=397260 RepID=UPI0004AEE523|nr:hypothetical protein [Sphingomonas sanxanigenens]
MSVLCKLRGHLPDRGTARHDGQDYWTNCKRCDAPLIRAPDGWRKPTADELAAHVGHKAESGQLDDDAGVVRGRSES